MILRSFFGRVIHYENKMVEACTAGVCNMVYFEGRILETNRYANARFTDETKLDLPKNKAFLFVARIHEQIWTAKYYAFW